MRLTVKKSGAGVDDGEADAVDGDGALLHDVAGEVRGQGDLHELPVLGEGLRSRDFVGLPSTWPLHDVPAEAGRRRRWERSRFGRSRW